MMTRGHIAEGFVWIGDSLNVSGSTICVFAFIVTAIIATSTGTSIGTILTMVPILMPVAAIMGANMNVLIGAIMSGALFGDSIGPVSDVTIASSQTQEFRGGGRRILVVWSKLGSNIPSSRQPCPSCCSSYSEAAER